MSMFKKKRAKKTDYGLLDKNSPFAFSEAYKTLRTNLSFISLSGKYKSIVLTSSIPDEGKSTVAANLAITLAESGFRVVLLDCDLRDPTLHRYLHFKSQSGEGLTDFLAGRTEAKDVCFYHNRHQITFIPAGNLPPNPAELLGSSRMVKLIKELRNDYDFILCDTPPVSVVTDAAVMGSYCDGILLVVKQKFSTRNQVRSAHQNLLTAGANVIGTVLNQYDVRQDSSQHSGSYGYYAYDYSYGE